MIPRNSIGRQAAIRLLISIGLLVVLIAVSSLGIYKGVVGRAAHQRTNELVSFYTARLQQIEQEWETHSRVFKARIESQRFLENPATLEVNLRAFMTLRRDDLSFQYLLIQGADGKKLFGFGDDISLSEVPLSAVEGSGHYQDPRDQQIYRVYQYPIWLGKEIGMGRLTTFTHIDNALLYQMSTPGLTLRVLYNNQPVASSAGQRDIDRLRYDQTYVEKETQGLPWRGLDNDPIRLFIDAPLTIPFSTTELSVGMSLIPLLNGLLLWFTIGLWLTRQTRRIAHLGEAVVVYTTDQQMSDAMIAKLASAKKGQEDDIANVADALSLMVATITQREQEEQEIAERLRISESTTRMKSDFLANMSHEIRTPMNAIIGLSHLMLKTELTLRQRDYLQKIQGSGQHLLGIINDILDLSKIEADKLVLDRIEFDLEKILGNVINLIVEKSTAKGLELIVDIDSTVPHYLVGDPLRLGQILVNYANNAVKFTEQGEIGLMVRVHEEVGQEVMIRFSVRDTGIGLNEDQKSKLFQNFSQVDTSATRRFGGTGLGLAICKRLAELMGGKVGVDSIPDQGSTFWFTALLSRGSTKTHTLLPKPNLRGRRVLVVDDSEHARTVFADMLTAMTFDVETVASGQAAVDAVRASARDRPYDLVALDWQMPGMDGLELVRQVRALGLVEVPHLIMVTAYDSEALFKQASDIGIEEVLIKPVSSSTLFNTTMRILGDKPQEELMDVPEFLVTEELATRKGARILLVEDNEINQEVAATLLREAGFIVDLAIHGALAVHQVQQVSYDLVLMDMQMPVMDGVTATLEIRQIATLTELPIVAMTANAMQQDRELCYAAGMVDYISKPIDPDDLQRILLKWIKPRTTPVGTGTEIKTTVATTIALPKIHGLDMTAGLRRMMNRPSLYLSMLRKFLTTQKGTPSAITAALDSGDWKMAKRLAHTLKGVAGSIGAHELQSKAARLEIAIGEDPLQRVNLGDRLAAVVTNLALLITELEIHFLPTDEIQPNLIADMEPLREVCAILATHLAEEDFEANRIFENNAQLLHSAFCDNDYREIEDGIRQFDFEKASQALKRAAEQAKVFKRRKSV